MDSYTFTLPQKLAQVVEAYPHRPALHYGAGSAVTFGELDALANRLARHLLGLGVQQEDVVCIFNNKSVRGYACMLACLKIGAIYVNLDVSSPRERLEKILSRANPTVIVNDFEEVDVFASHSPEGTVLRLHSVATERALEEQDAGPVMPPRSLTGASPAYLMFTSGSTGFPKGAIMSHQNILNFIQWGQSTFAVTPEDVFTNVNPIYFDNSVFDFYTSLFNGASLAPIPHTLAQSPLALVQHVGELGCTVWFSVPSLLIYLLVTRALKKTDFPHVRTIIFGGEGFPKPKLKKLFDLFGDRIDLVNVYGPTECTCICSSYGISAEDFSIMDQLAPLGYLAPNFSGEILPSDTQNPSFGELCLKGPNVGLGYYNDPDRTAASFTQNPNNDRFVERVYRTGDLVERDEAGMLHFRGRVDNQIKHMGYRIELEEIEAGISTLPGVDEVAVLYQRLGDGMGQIIAFVRVADGTKTDALKAGLEEKLPPYMMPRRIRTLEALPKNPNGKIDKVQLRKLFST